MTTSPAGVFKKVYPPNGGVTLQNTTPTDWANFCNVGDATALAAEINAKFGTELVITPTPFVDQEETLGYLVLNPSGPRMYALSGTLSDGTPFYIDPVGSFLDREANPNPFLDRNSDTSLGGTNIILQQVAPGVTVLRWGK